MASGPPRTGYPDSGAINPRRGASIPWVKLIHGSPLDSARVAVAIGFIALTGVAAETGVLMLIYLDHAWNARCANRENPSQRDLYDAVVEGAVERVRPKLMTVSAIMAGLLPFPPSILYGRDARPVLGRGASTLDPQPSTLNPQPSTLNWHAPRALGQARHPSPERRCRPRSRRTRPSS